MRTIKVILGFLLIISAGREYINASRQLGSFFSPGIILGILVLLILSAWLIGSGFTARKLKFKSIEFLKFFLISFVLLVIVAFFSISSSLVPKDYKMVNGIKIPMSKCIDGTVRIFSNEKEREEYCLCIAEKITSNTELKEKYRKNLEDGKLGEIFIEIQNNDKYNELTFDNCLINSEIKWTDKMGNSMVQNWKNELEGTEFEITNDIDKYCNCLLEEYQKYPLGKIIADDFLESQIAGDIEEKCIEFSKK